MLKKQNGITLIALIITIIVMLILVGVTINVALNGGLFTKASDASKQMQIEAEKEELLSAVVAAIGEDGKVSIPYLDDNLPGGWSGTGGTYTSPKENTFTVEANGKITYTGNNSSGGNGNTPETDLSEQLELLQTYFLGEIDETTGQRPGKSLEDIVEDPDLLDEVLDGEAAPREIKFRGEEPINNAYNIV